MKQQFQNYKFVIAYDGSRYKGWQIQPKEENTIQGKLQKVLGELCREPVAVIGSGRTDSGVHALAQIANVHLPLDPKGISDRKEYRTYLEPEALLHYMNAYLPQDIAVLSIEKVPEHFHARYHAVNKTYRYRIYTSFIPNVFERKYVYTYTEKQLDTAAMRAAAEKLCGTHDFTSFCGNKHMKKSRIRTLFSIEIREEREEIVIEYTGDGFLQNMVRILTGTLIEVGIGKIPVTSMQAILEEKNRSAAGFTAPPEGLVLVKVRY